MAYVALPQFLFRAPLLPMRALRDPRRGVLAHPLGATAIELASPALAAARARAPEAADAARAVERYGRRAAFRPTPHGLWAGVGVGRMALRTDVRTLSPSGHLAASWMRMADLGRALLDRPDVRARVRLRRAPSLNIGARTVTWLGPSGPDGFCEEHAAELDETLEAALRICERWMDWPALRTALAGPEAGDGESDEENADELDDWLLTLIDDGVLLADTVPPLVGPPAGQWMAERLTRLPAGDVARQLEIAQDALRAGRLAEATAALARLPGARGQAGAGVQATLLFSTEASAGVTLSRQAVARAAALAPLLFRLQEALAPPAAERTPGRALAEALDAATEIFGAGALDLAALARGDYGTAPASEDGVDTPDVDAGAGTSLVVYLVDRIVAAAAARSIEIALDGAELEPLLPAAPAPPTCELFLTPRRPRPRDRAGAGWLLGLHAPAGASWGRFAAALGDEAAPLFAALKTAERRARPDETPLDVIYAPSARLAELTAHPPLRDAALAISAWPADDRAAVTLDELELVADPAALQPLALRAADAAVTPSPLHRVRSTTAPPGVWRLLVGWSLHRQHAPWALALGPLAGLDWTPRVTLDGFVISPASWRLPASATATARGLADWRRAHRVPRLVQVGHEDELLPVDLTARDARKLLAGHDRVHEIWPPLGDTPDRAGRRIEAVVALVDAPDADQQAFATASAAATRAAGAVPAPGDVPRDDGAPAWRTFKLFGAADRQDPVLADVVAPLLKEAHRTGWLTGWFFQRYVEGPGRRPHLRLRAAGDTTAFGAALEARLEDARRAGDIVAVEQAPYFPEAARFGGAAALPAVHALFQAASELILAALVGDADDWPALASVDDPRLLLLIGACDAVARAAGLDTARRRALAQQRRAAHADDVDDDFARDLADGFRGVRAALRTLLGRPSPAPYGGKQATQTTAPAPPFGRILDVFEDGARTALARLTPAERERILPALAHLDAVRLMGPDREAEIRAYTYWERTLDSLERHSASPEDGQR